MDSVNEDVSARILLENILFTEPSRTPITRSASKAQAAAQQSSSSGDQRSARQLRRRDAGVLTPQEALKQNLKQKIRESTSRVSLHPSNRRTVSAGVRRTNTPGPATASQLYDDDITPRLLLRNILRTEPEVSLLVQEKANQKEPELPSANSSLNSNRPSTGLDLPDDTDTASTVKGLRRKRPRRSLNITAFEKRLGDGKVKASADVDMEAEEAADDLASLSSSSEGSATLSLKTPYVDVRTEKKGLQRKVAKRRKLSVERFAEAVRNREEDGYAEVCTEETRPALSETARSEGFSLCLSDYSLPDITTDILHHKTALYPPAATMSSTFTIPATQEKDTVTATQIQRELADARDEAEGGLEREERMDVEGGQLVGEEATAQSQTEEEEEAALVSRREDDEAGVQSQNEDQEAKTELQNDEEADVESQNEDQEADIESQNEDQEADIESQNEDQEADVESQNEDQEAEVESQNEDQEAEVESQNEDQEAEVESQNEDQEADVESQNEDQEADIESQNEDQEAEVESQNEDQEADIESQNEDQEADVESQNEDQEAEVESQNEDQEADVESQNEDQEADVESQNEDQEAEVESQNEDQEAEVESQNEDQEAEVESQNEDQEAEVESQNEDQEAEVESQNEEEAEVESQNDEEEADVESQNDEEEAEVESQNDEEEAEVESQNDEEEADVESQNDEAIAESQTEDGAADSQEEEDAAVVESQTEEGDAAVVESQTEEEDDAAVVESQTEEEDAAVVECQTEEEDAAVVESQTEEEDAAVVESQTEEDAAVVESQTEEEEDAAVVESQTEEEDAAVVESQTEEEDAAANSQTEEGNARDSQTDEGELAESPLPHDSEHISRRAFRSEGGLIAQATVEGGRGYKSMGAVPKDTEAGMAGGESVADGDGEWHSGPGLGSSESVQPHVGIPNSAPCSPHGSTQEEAGSDNEEQENYQAEDSGTSPPADPDAAQEPSDQEEEWDDEEDDEVPEVSMKTPAFVREKRNVLLTDPLASPAGLKNLQPSVSGKSVAPAKPKKARAKQDGPAKKVPGLPKTYLMGNFRHFAKTKVSPAVYPVLQDILDKFFDRMVADLETYSTHAKRKTIEVEDCELLLRRQGYVNDKVPVEVLIEKYLPLEYRKLLIPIATSGNVVIPKPRR